MRRGFLNAITDLLDGDSPDSKDPIADAVRDQLPDADAEYRTVVTAITGLLACVAYADGVYDPREADLVRSALQRFDGLSAEATDVIARVVERSIGSATASGHQRWVRDLKELTSRSQRVELLELLVELAAADEELSSVEANYLRRLTDAMGLSQADYNSLQSRHRDKLTVLK